MQNECSEIKASQEDFEVCGAKIIRFCHDSERPPTLEEISCFINRPPAITDVYCDWLIENRKIRVMELYGDKRVYIVLTE
jgi:hypothetical protein